MSTTDQPDNQENEAADATTAVVETPEFERDADGASTFEFVEDPSFELDYKGDCAYEAKVTIPAANKAKKMEEMLVEVQEEVSLPGFRRGKAPRKLIENKFAKALRGDVFQELVSAAVEKMLKDKELKPYNPPDFDGVEEAIEKNDDEDISILVKFEVYPKVEVGDYSGQEVERPFIKVDDKDVLEAIGETQQRQATYETVDEKAKAQEGDQVIIDFKGEIDGEAFEGGAAENYPYILGSGYFFSEFEAALQGVKQGQELTCQVNFPEDYSNKAFAGKKADFSIKVNEIKRKTLPELDDDFAKEMGHDSLDAFKAKVKADLEAGALQQSQAIVEDRAIAAAVSVSTHELPKSLVENMAKEYVEQERRRLVALRVPVSEWEAREAEIVENARQAAERDVKGWITLHEIGVKAGVQVTDEDFAEEANAIQARTGAERAVVEKFLSSQEQRSEYAERIYRRKAIKVILDGVKIVDKEVTREAMEELEENVDENA